MSVFYHTEKKIAFPIALLFLIILVISTSFAIQKIKTVNLKANTIIFDAIEITNITHKSATIIWHTDAKTKGWILFGTNKNILLTSAFDDRDTINHKNIYSQHYVTLKNLDKNTRYYFNIASSQGIYTSQGHTPFSFMTSPELYQQKGIKPAFGKSINTNGSPAAESVVLLKIDGALILSTLTKTTGEWLIPLFSLIDKKTHQPLVFTDKTPVIIEIRNENNEKALFTTTIGHVSPVPETIIMGQNKEFIEEKINVLADFTTFTPSLQTEVDIIFPKDNAIIPGKRPLIKGTALPLAPVTMKLSSISTTHTFTFKSSREGIWSFTPPSDLSEEKYTLVITTHDMNNTPVTKTRMFTIAKSGESVLGDATPAATMTQTPTQALPQPTIPPTTIVTRIPSPPVTGNMTLSIPLIGSGLFILGLGFIMLF